MSKYRDWCWQHVSEDKQDSGANDEGYYYHFCNSCYRRTEHEAGSCCQCGEYNDPEYWDQTLTTPFSIALSLEEIL